MTTAETLLAERLDDLRSDDGGGFGAEGHKAPAGNVRTTVDHLLDMAFDSLWHNDYTHADIITAGAHVDASIKLLTAYWERLTRLNELDEDETMLAQGWTKVGRGTYTPPEGWTPSATRDA
jgi:hypothetical protein